MSSGDTEGERREKAKLGWFSFQDYACSQWYSHIDTTIAACRDLFSHPHLGETYRERFGSALQDFIAIHNDDLTKEQHQDLEQLSPKLAAFSDLSFYRNLCLLWNHIYTHQKGSYEIRCTVGLAQLDKALLQNRITIEGSFKPDSEAWLNDTIGDYYGANLFKCKRVLCKFFYQGYDKKKDRDTHDSRHERPFLCPLDCNFALTGFSSKKDRERHVRIYHPDHNDGPSVFEALHSRTGELRFTCNICNKKFTRKITLKGHERSHFGDRPYGCSVCSKSFARVNDCRRHERSIHARQGA